MRKQINKLLKRQAPTLVVISTMVVPMQVAAQETTHSHVSKYAGQQSRAIKSLSAEDIAELESGAGWGLAKSAELNGVPGPLHLLEMKEAIDLSADQITAIENLYQQMKASAIELGQSLIEQERQLENRFQHDIPKPEELKTLLSEIGKTRSALRYVHLSAHLETPDILTAEQMSHYNQLRGYAEADPCDSVPEGHNAAMWKKHNNCE